MNFDAQLRDLKNGETLSRNSAAQFLGYVLDDKSVSDDKIVEMLTILSTKDLKADELSGFIDAMRARMVTIKPINGAIDTCGTGGDKSGTFNISTASAILVASAGVPVAKHGNRAATSKCGSADVLEALRIPVDLPADEAQKYLEQNNFVFLFATLYHPSLKRLVLIRRQLGFPTVFNLLGPLLNPAGVKRQVIGTFSKKNAELIAQVVAQMDYERVIVLSSQDGLDEASLNSPVDIYEIRQKTVTQSTITAQDFGLESVDNSDLLGGDADTNAKMIVDAMKPSRTITPQQAIIIFNSAIALYAAARVHGLEEGVELATEIIKKGTAQSKLESLMKRA